MLTKMGISVLALVGIVGTGGVVHAAPDWNMIGSACVPSEDSAGYDMAGNRVEFLGTQTGDIHLTCPVTIADNTSVSKLEMEYDDDGGAAYYVHATLKYSEAGSTTDLCTAISTVSTFDMNDCTFTAFNMDTDIAHLYVYVRIHRDSGATAFNPRFYGLRLY